MAKATKEKLGNVVGAIWIASIGLHGRDLVWWLNVLNVAISICAVLLFRFFYRRSSDRILFWFIFSFLLTFVAIDGRPAEHRVFWLAKLAWLGGWALYGWRKSRTVDSMKPSCA